MVHGLLLFVHIIVSIALIISVLLQSSKGGGLAGTFGGSGITGGIFGGRGAAPFLVKATTAFAILFMVTSISLNFIKSSSTAESVLERTNMGSSVIGSEPAVTDEMPISLEGQDTEQGTQETGTVEDGEASEQTDSEN